MGIDLKIGMFVNDATFLPTTEQLVGIAAILEETSIIDHAERDSLEQRITATYRGEDTPDVWRDGEYVLGVYDYMKTSPEALPYFNYSFSRGEVLRHYIIVYKEPRCMQPMAGNKYTRLVIAELDDPDVPNIDEQDALVDKLEEDPFLVSLRSRMAEMLGVSVVVEVMLT